MPKCCVSWCNERPVEPGSDYQPRTYFCARHFWTTRERGAGIQEPERVEDSPGDVWSTATWEEP